MATLEEFLYGCCVDSHVLATNSFNLIAPGLFLDLELVAVNGNAVAKKRSSRYSDELFQDLYDDAVNVFTSDIRSKRTYVSEEVKKEYSDDLWREFYAQAVENRLNSVRDDNDDAVTLVRVVGELEDFRIYLLFRFKGDILRRSQVMRDAVFYGTLRRGSLVTTLLSELCADIKTPLRLKEQIIHFVRPDRSSEDRVRAAGALFLQRFAFDIGSQVGGLYEHLCKVAALTYEGAESKGLLHCASPSSKALEVAFKLEKPVPMANCKAIRKLLEISSHSFGLLSDSDCVFGFGQAVDIQDAAPKSFSIRFTRAHAWSLIRNGNTLMDVRYSLPSLPREKYDKAEAHDALVTRFGSLPGFDERRLMSILDAATDQAHGTMLAISTQAKAEVQRLEGQATPVSPFELTPDIMRRVSSIDGAVVIDPTCTCFGIGVILDGQKSDRCDPSRGARFNSAVRFVDASEGRMAIVVSEDGLVNII